MNALTSLWNGALTGLREQTVRTPYWLLDCLLYDWGAIALDPCADPDLRVPADGHVSWHAGEDGLVPRWVDRTYANPEFANLKLWLSKAIVEAEVMREEESPGRIALLCPARGHRKWYREAQRDCREFGGIVQFDPFAFTGHKDKFPALLELLCWNFRPTPWVWAPYGEVE